MFEAEYFHWSQGLEPVEGMPIRKVTANKLSHAAVIILPCLPHSLDQGVHSFEDKYLPLL